jgi:hypothetical protein
MVPTKSLGHGRREQFINSTAHELETLAFPNWKKHPQASADMPRPAEKMTACLLSWKRPRNIEIIVAALQQVNVIDEILIWNNNPDVALNFTDGKIRVVRAPENHLCYGRFLCAAQARNHTIYVQDDDVINHDIEGLYRQFVGDPSRIAHALSEAHWEHRDRHIHGEAHVALLGWGAIFSKDWLAVLENLPPALLGSSLFRREADKFFSILLQRRHNSVRGRLRHLDGHATGPALWRQPNHRHFKASAICQSLRIVRQRHTPHPPVPWNVVITCRNYGRYLGGAVESVLANDADLEIHIVDDCSSDSTAEVAADYVRRFPNIRYIRNASRCGAGYSRNRGIAAADSRFVILLDADDRIGANYLFEAARLLESGSDVVNPDAILFGIRRARWNVPDVTTLQMLLERNHVHCCSAFVRELWLGVGGIDEEMPCWMDYDFWIRLAAAGARIRRLRGDHFFYQQHHDSLTHRSRRLRGEVRAYLDRKHAALQSISASELP